MKTVNQRRQTAIARAIKNANKENVLSSFDMIEDFNKVVRLERKYNRLQELSCNGYPKIKTEYKNGKMYRYNEWDEELQAKSEAQEKKIEEQLQDIARKNEWFIRTQGDPRGATVQIDFFTEPNESQECSHTHILYA